MRGWGSALAAAFFLTGWTVLAVIPGELWIQAHTIQISDSKAGNPVLMTVHRDVKKEFRGRYHTTLYRETELGWVAVSPQCERVSSWIDYSPTRPLPVGDELNLAWWVGGDCRGAELVPGKYQLSTKWEIYRRVLPNAFSGAVLSNFFQIH